MIIDFSELSAQAAYITLTQTVVPRPIAWVLSENATGTYNLAPYSFFNAVGSSPPSLLFSVGLQADGTAKDTLRNIQQRKHFVVNMVSAEQLAVMNQTSATLAPDESEVSANNIALADFAGSDFKLPRVANSPVAFACELDQVVVIGDNEQALVIGKVSMAHVIDQAIASDD